MTMRDQEKPFILFRRNRFIYNITPRNASGWIQKGVWKALFLAMIAGFAAFDGIRPADSTFGSEDAVFLLAVLAWAIGSIWWMRARAEVIDVNAVLGEKRKQESNRRGR
jgi:hypothetical protein